MPYPLLLPKILFGGRYLVLEGPRRGGQAEVYRAIDQKLQRYVALKVTPAASGPAATDWYAKLQDESRLIARLDNHPAVVRIYDLDQIEEEEGDGRLLSYASLEWMEGGSASRWAAEAPAEEPGRAAAATRIAIGAAHGLVAAHAAGILHLDVTPDNVLLTADGTAKLADFGVAVAVEGPRGISGWSPQGKADFASPEQRDHRPVDARSDVYSLGATYCHLLTGRTPARPGQDPQALDASIPAVCAEVARKAMAPAPDQRYQNVAELLRALESARDELSDPTRPAYLAWLQRVHGMLRLPVINRHVPLDRVYTALRVAPTSMAAWRETSRRISRLIETGSLAPEADPDPVDEAEDLARVVELPYALTLDFLDRPDPLGPSGGKPVTLGEAYGQWPVLVILGDPGSGKTTIARWLVRAAAESCALGSGTFRVRKCKVDPNAAEDETSFDLGRTRLPVFVRAADYARYREEREQTDLSLLGYLTSACCEGYDQQPTYGEDAPERLRGAQVPPGGISRLIRSAIVGKSALIVIDGLDEIPSDSTRGAVRNAIQAFIGEHARPDGGNLVVLTSRIVGYQLNALEGLDVGHVVVERMEEPAVRHFVRSWLGEVEPRPDRAAENAEGLTAEIFNPARRGLRDLASNPLLAGVLTAVFHRGGGLPETRVELFEAAIQEFLAIWEERARQVGQPTPPDRDQVVRLLERLAESIHTHQTTGLLLEGDLKRKLTQFLCADVGIDELTLDPPPEVVARVAGLLALIKEPIGLIVARYETVYGFIHLAFQEYLAARYLLRANRPAGIVENLRPRLEDPRWREPLLMALGRFAQQHPDRLIELVRLVLAEDGRYGDLLPRGALLVVAALPELARCPDELAALLMERLLRASIEAGGPTRFGPLRELIEESIPRIRLANDRAAESEMRKALGRPDLAPAAASVLLRHEWYNRALGTALLQHCRLDSAAWGWPIHAALREMATAPAPPRKPWAPAGVQEAERERQAMEKAETEEQRSLHRAGLERLQREHADAIAGYAAAMAEYTRASAEHQATLRFRPGVDLPVDLLPLRRLLEGRPELRDKVAADPGWSTLIIGLYGGVGDYRTVERLREYRRFANFLQLPDSRRRPFLEFLKERWGEEDPIYKIAVHLDTNGAEWSIGWQVRPDFRPQFLAQDSPLTNDLILPSLRADRPAAELVDDLERYAREGSQEQRADAILGLVLLGAGDRPAAIAGLRDPGVVARLSRASTALRDPVTRMSHHIVTGLSALARERPDRWADVVSATLVIIIERAPIQVDTAALFRCAPIKDDAYVLAEHLVARFVGGADDEAHLVDATLKSFNKEYITPWGLIRAIALAPLARFRRHPGSYYRWDFEQVPPHSFATDDIPPFVLTAVENIDRRISMVRSWAIGEILQPILVRQPQLLPELLAVALRDVGDRSDRAEFVKRLAPSLEDPGEIHCAVRAAAERLESPYYKARALIRLLPFFPAERDRMLDAILPIVRRVANPHRRVQVMEQLLAASGRSRRWALQGLSRLWFGSATRGGEGGLVHEALKSAASISDPDDKARAMARLASYQPTPEAQECLYRAMHIAMKKIRDERQLTETIRLLMPQLAGFPEVERRVLELPRAREPRIREALLDRVGPAIQQALPGLFRLSPPDSTGWAAVAASARLRDSLPPDPSTCDQGRLWGSLGSDFRPATIDALRSRAEAEGLTLSRTAAHVLDRLDEAQLRALEDLLPFVHSSEPETTPLLADWLRRGAASASLARLASLLLAERHGLTLETVSAVADCLAETDDRIRLRAMGIVQHPAVIPEHGPTRPTSVVGLDVLMELVRKCLAVPESSRWRGMMRQVIGDMSSDLIHDSPGILGALIEEVRHDPGVAHPVLGRLPREPDPARPGIAAEALLAVGEAVAPGVWDTLLEGLRAGPIPVRMVLLRFLMTMVYRTTGKPARYGLTPDRWGDVVAVLDQLAPGDLPEVGIYLDGIEGIVESAGAALEVKMSPGARVARARSEFERRIRPLTDLVADPPKMDVPVIPKGSAEAWAQLSGPDPGARRARLLSLFARVGARLLTMTADCRIYLRPSEAVAERFRRRPDVLHVLCDWLHETLSSGGPELGLGSFESDLLLAVAQGTSVQPEVLPSRYERDEDREELTRLLVAAAQFHRDRIARCAAVILLGRLLVAHYEILPAFQSALLDYDDVQDGALIAATYFRRYSPGFVEQLVGRPEARTGLYHESALAAFGFGTLLEALGRSDQTDADGRQGILSALADAVRHPATDRVVPLGYTAAGLPELPKLNQMLYRMLLRVAGVESPRQGGGVASR